MLAFIGPGEVQSEEGGGMGAAARRRSFGTEARLGGGWRTSGRSSGRGEDEELNAHEGGGGEESAENAAPRWRRSKWARPRLNLARREEEGDWSEGVRLTSGARAQRERGAGAALRRWQAGPARRERGGSGAETGPGSWAGKGKSGVGRWNSAQNCLEDLNSFSI